ncbi:FHIPEP family type III secretion protein [Nocardioides zeae]
MIALDPTTGHLLLTRLAQLVTETENRDIRPVLVCAPPLRPAVRRMTRPILPQVPVLAYSELSGGARVQSAGVVSVERRMAVAP